MAFVISATNLDCPCSSSALTFVLIVNMSAVITYHEATAEYSVSRWLFMQAQRLKFKCHDCRLEPQLKECWSVFIFLMILFFREETTMKFSMTRGPSVSQSTLQRTQSGYVGSFSLTLRHTSPDVLKRPRSLYPQTPLTPCLWFCANRNSNPGYLWTAERYHYWFSLYYWYDNFKIRGQL